MSKKHTVQTPMRVAAVVFVLLASLAYPGYVFTRYARGVADAAIYVNDTWDPSSITTRVNDQGDTLVSANAIRGVLLESERQELIKALHEGTNRELIGKMRGTSITSGVVVGWLQKNKWNLVVSVEIFDHATPQSQKLYLTQPNVAEFEARLQQRPAFNRLRDRAVWFGSGLVIPAFCWIVGLLACRRSKSNMTAAHAAALKAKETELATVTARTGALAEALGRARADLVSEEEKRRGETQAHRSAVAEIYSSLDRRWKARFAAENILKSAFIALYDDRASQRQGGAGATQAHDLSQSLEWALADLLLHDRARLALIELKKRASEFHSEIKKKFQRRNAQMRKVSDDPTMLATSRACHFGGWGVAAGSADMEFTPYLDAWKSCSAKIDPEGSISALDFLTGFLPDDETEARFGVEGSRFIQYVKLLESCAPSGTNSDTSAFILVYRANGAVPEAFHVPSLAVLVEVLVDMEDAEMKRIAAVDAERAQEQERNVKGPSGIGGR